MKPNLPLVTVVSPSYNHSKYIIESLESVRNQTYTNIQHIIIDDCSTDNSVELIEEWIANHNYNCIFIKNKKNIGIAKNLNKGIDLAKGIYWTPLATDDIFSLNFIEDFVELFNQNSEYEVLVGDSQYIDSLGKIVKRENCDTITQFALRIRNDVYFDENFGNYDSLVQGNYISNCYMFRKQTLLEIEKYNTKRIIEDWDLFLRISNKKKIHFINKVYTYYRIHETNTITIHPKIKEDTLKILLEQIPFVKNKITKRILYKKLRGKWLDALKEKDFRIIMLFISKVQPITLIQFTLKMDLENVE